MKKIIFAVISAFAISSFVACSADALANADSTDKTGPTGVISNDKNDAAKTSTEKSDDSAKSSSSSKKSSSSSK